MTVTPKKRRGRKSAMAKHRAGVVELALMLVAAGYTQFDDDGREGSTLPPFSFMVSERYRMSGAGGGILRDLVLRTDGGPVDIKAYFYTDAASHTSILRVPTYMMAYASRKPQGRYLNLITGVGNSLLFDIMAAQTGTLDLQNPSGIWLLDQTLDQLEAYRRQQVQGLTPA